MQNGAIWQRVAGAAVNQRFEGLPACCMFWIRLSSSSMRLRRAFDVSACRDWLFQRFSKSLYSATENRGSARGVANAID